MQATRLRPAATLLLAASLAALLCACGGGGGSQATTAHSTSGAAQTQGQSPLPGHPKIATKPPPAPGSPQAQGNRYGNFTRAGAAAAERRAARRARAARRRLARKARKAGKAAPFLVPVGDNSIPTYGSQGSASQQSEAEAALNSYLSARESGEWSGACSHMAATEQKQLAALAGASEGCPAAYAKLSSRVPATSRANVLVGPLAALRVEGDKAFALFYGPHGQQYMMPMASEGGAWKVNQIEPISWPIGSSANG